MLVRAIRDLRFARASAETDAPRGWGKSCWRFAPRLCRFPLCPDGGQDGNGLIVGVAGRVEEGQGGFGKVAFVGDLPFVVGFNEHRSGQTQQCRGLGKTPTTSVRRLISLLRLSSGLVLQIFFQCRTGKSAKAVMSSAAARSMDSTLGSWRPSMCAMVSSCSRTCSAPGWAKMVRIAAATISADPLGTWANTLRRKWTRHLCQAAPMSAATPVAMTTACDTTRWLTRALQ